MTFNYLQYSVYKTCPLQYKWKFVLRPDVRIIIDKRFAFLGLVLQKLVERLYKERWWQSKPIERMKQALPLISQQFIDAENIKFQPHELQDWLNIARDTIPKILNVIKTEKLLSDEVYLEREEESSLDDDILQFRPDMVMRRDGVITLLDGKGGKTVGRYVDPDQIIFYAGATESIYNRLPHRAGFWWYRHERIVWVPVSHETVEEVRNKARTFISGIKASQFEPTPGQHCRLCDFRQICDEGSKFLDSRHKISDAPIPEGNFGEVTFG